MRTYTSRVSRNDDDAGGWVVEVVRKEEGLDDLILPVFWVRSSFQAAETERGVRQILEFCAPEKERL